MESSILSAEKIDMREPNAWKRLTRWQRWMVLLDDRFNGDTGLIIKNLAKERGFSPELDVYWSKYLKDSD
jgi:hypothetical protein